MGFLLDHIDQIFSKSLKVHELIDQDQVLKKVVEQAALHCIQALKTDQKLLFCGNGGSAADAQHIAAELTGRFYKDRSPINAEALHVNTSYVTAVANDYGYDHVFSRMLEAKAVRGDVLFGLSTSGNSPNVVKAFEKAKEIGVKTIAMTGAKDSKLKLLSDITIQVPSDDTPRIQECHILIGHILCELIEKEIFN